MKNVKILNIKTGDYGPVSKVRLFIETKNESLVGNLTFRHARPYKTYRKFVLPVVLEKLGLSFLPGASWSQKAGCYCGCSPGYILDIHPSKVGYEAVWVTIK